MVQLNQLNHMFLPGTLMESMVNIGTFEHKIYSLRGQKVMLDSDLAELCGASTKRLNEQVRRNTARFPEDFMFQLLPEEFDNLRSHIATSSYRHGGRVERSET